MATPLENTAQVHGSASRLTALVAPFGGEAIDVGYGMVMVAVMRRELEFYPGAR
jgi:hypothetical protein